MRRQTDKRLNAIISPQPPYTGLVRRETGMGKRGAVEIVLDDVERRELTALTRKHGAPQTPAARARIVPAAADELDNKAIAARVGVCAATAGTWRNRFANRRLDGLYETSLSPARRARSATTRSRARSARPWRRARAAARTGA